MKYRRLALCALPFVLLVLQQTARADNDQPIYDDRFSNGWQNWSWAQTNVDSTTVVHSGAASIQVTYNAPSQGFYLRAESAVDTSLYTNLVFWINGGSSSGRTINVHAILNAGPGDSPPTTSDRHQPALPLDSFIQGGGVAAGTWRKVTVPLSALQASNSPLIGVILQEGGESAEPSFYLDDISLSGAPLPAQIHLNVNAGQIIRTVDPRTFGLNTAVWDGFLNSGATVNLLSSAGTKFLRFPGGSTSDEFHWQTNTAGGNRQYSDTDAFASVVARLNAQAIITANYGTGTPDEAANWVRYTNITNGYAFKYWEIGNENYGQWETDSNPVPHDPFTYANEAKVYITEMKAVDPAIRIGVVIDRSEDSFVNNMDHPATNPRTGMVHNGWTPVLLATLKSLGVFPDFVIYHRYDQNPGNEGDARLLQSSSTWKFDAAAIRQMLNDYLGNDNAAGIEILCTEHNSVSSNPGKQATSLVNGLFEADTVGQILQTEFNSLVWWDLRNSQESGNNNDSSLYGWRNYGDYGLVTPSASSTPYPTYYVAELLGHFASGGDHVALATSDFALLSAYAAQRSDGSLSLLVVNKSPVDDLTGNVAISGYSPVGQAGVYSYGIAQDNAARTGSSSPEVAFTTFDSAAQSFTFSFPAYSATVISLRNTPAAGPMIASAHFDGKKNLTIQGNGFGSGARVLINGTDISPFIKSDSDSLIKLKAKAKFLGLKTGANTIQVVTSNGTISNVYSLTL